MLRYALNRILMAVPTLLIVAVIVFTLMRFVSGDPAQLMLGDLENPEALARLRKELGLDKPVPVQFMIWLERAVVGNFGDSIAQQRPVIGMLWSGFRVTASVVIPAVLLAALIAVPLGMLAAWKQNTKADAAIVGLSILFLSVPSFWLGLLFLLFLGIYLDLFPVVGYVSPRENWFEGIRYLVLPVMTMALIVAGGVLRIVVVWTVQGAGPAIIRSC